MDPYRGLTPEEGRELALANALAVAAAIRRKREYRALAQTQVNESECRRCDDFVAEVDRALKALRAAHRRIPAGMLDVHRQIALDAEDLRKQIRRLSDCWRELKRDWRELNPYSPLYEPPAYWQNVVGRRGE